MAQVHRLKMKNWWSEMVKLRKERETAYKVKQAREQRAKDLAYECLGLVLLERLRRQNESKHSKHSSPS